MVNTCFALQHKKRGDERQWLDEAAEDKGGGGARGGLQRKHAVVGQRAACHIIAGTTPLNALQCTAQHSTAQHSTAQHSTAQHSTSHHLTSLHIASHHITSHHITSHHITSHHITSHHITSHHIKHSTAVTRVHVALQSVDGRA